MALPDRPVGMVGQRHSYAASASEAPASLTPYALQGAFRGARPFDAERRQGSLLAAPAVKRKETSMSPRKKSLWQERGQTLTEHAGIGLVVVALLLVVAGGITVTSGDKIGQAVLCKISQHIHSVAGGSYECPLNGNPYAANPAAVPSYVSETSKSTSAGVTIPKLGPGDLKVDGSDNASIKKTRYMDGSGSRQYSKTTEVSASYDYSTSKHKAWKKRKANEAGKSSDDDSDSKGAPFDAEIQASIKGSINRTTTKTYKCDTPGHPTCRQHDKRNREVAQEHLDDQGLGRATSGDTEVKQKPDSTSTSWTAEAELEGGVSVSTEIGVKDPEDTKKGNKKGGKERRYDPKDAKEAAKEKVLNYGRVKAKASTSASGKVGYTRTETHADGKTETSNRFAYKGEVNAELAGSAFGENNGKNSTNGSYYGSYELTYDDDGELKTITFTNVKEHQEEGRGGKSESKTTTITTTLDVSGLSQEDRKIAEKYASRSFTNGALFVTESSFKPSKPSSDSFDNLLYRQGQTTRTVQEGEMITENGGWDFWVLRYQTQSTHGSQDTIKAQQLGRPGPDGERTFEDVE